MRLEVRELSVGYAGEAVMAPLSFEVTGGDRVALAGPSGCGKTTALRSIAWLHPPIEGSVTLDGRGPPEHGVPAFRRRVVHVAQRAVFFGGLVREELARPFSYRTASSPYDAVGAREALEAVGLDSRYDTAVGALSEGERQRVALIRAVLLCPDVLLLDEPTSSLDVDTTREVERWLSGLEAAIIFVSHDPIQRERVAGDRVIKARPADG